MRLWLNEQLHLLRMYHTQFTRDLTCNEALPAEERVKLLRIVNEHMEYLLNSIACEQEAADHLATKGAP